MLNEEFTRLKPINQRIINLDSSEKRFNLRYVTAEEVYKMIFDIKSNGTGPDEIPPICFKLLADYISEPIANLVNVSFDTGIFPQGLKRVAITPIPKVENPIICSQYRPISNANFLLKIISKLCCHQLTEYLETNNLISKHQSGFRKGHSCTTAILKLTEDLHKSIAKRKCVILVLLDFSNAFGSVDHNILLHVLESNGIRERTLEWYNSFLSNWQQIVKHNGKSSKQITITRGIIQGENNSQLLFTIFINQIIKYIKFCKIIMYADDVQLYLECDVDSIHSGISKVNEEMKNVMQFCQDFGVEINSKKSKAIIISSNIIEKKRKKSRL